VSLSGSLEDVSVADVLQFIHIGGRSGTLSLTRGDSTGRIVLHRGRIVSACGSRMQRLGELLVAQDVVSESDVQAALREQARRPRSLGRVLVELGLVTEERLLAAAQQHVQNVVYELVSWTQGGFEFAPDDLEPVDDLALSPGDVLPDLHLDTQMILLEAARIFDERSRERPGGTVRAGPEPKTTPPRQPSAPEAPRPAQAPAATNGGLLPSRPARSHTPRPRAASAARRTVPAARTATSARAEADLSLVCDDRELTSEVEHALGLIKIRPAVVSYAEAERPVDGMAPVVLLDARDGERACAWLERVGPSRPGVAFVAIVANAAVWTPAYAAGALAVVPDDVGAIVACAQGLLAQRRQHCADKRVREGLRSGFAKLRKLYGDARSGLLTATAALNLMNTISESVERAVLLVVRRSDLMVLGSFGHTADGQPLAERSQGLTVPLEEADVFAQVIREGELLNLSYDEARLPSALELLLGPPASNECSVFPVLGARRVVAVVYADNGSNSLPIDEMAFLEVATSQMGVVYENELLRRELDSRPRLPTTRPAAMRDPRKRERG